MFDQRGEGRIGLVIWLAIAAAGVFAAVKIVPAKVATMELHDFADSQAQTAGVSARIDEAKLLDSIVKKARELELPLDKKGLKLEVAPNEVRLRMKYTVQIDLSVYTMVWNFDEKFTHLRM